jgi:hypothetical protein
MIQYTPTQHNNKKKEWTNESMEQKTELQNKT